MLFGLVVGILNLVHQALVCLGRHILVEVVDWIDVGALVDHLVVEVWRCGNARISHIGNELATLYCVALRNVNLVKMGIACLISKSVIYKYLRAISISCSAAFPSEERWDSQG